MTEVAEHDTLTITFADEGEKAKAFFELIHSRAQFRGIGRNTFVVSKKDCISGRLLGEVANVIARKERGR